MWLALPVGIGAIAALRWWMPDDAGGARGEREDHAIPVELAAIQRGAISARQRLSGALEPAAEIVITAEIDGTVQAVNVDLADEVEPLQVLARLDDRESRQALAAARAALQVANARVLSAESAETMAQRALQRAEALAERGIASQRTLDEARAAASQAQADHAVARAEVGRSRAELQAAQLRLERTRIAGRWSAETGTRRVAARHVDEGARVRVGDPLFTLVDTDPLVVAVMVGTTEYARLEPGQEVDLYGPGDQPVKGRVARMAPAFETESRQARVEIEVPNEDGSLRPGVFVRVAAVVDTTEDADIVPAVAVVQRAGRDVVFVVRDGVAHQVPVEVGLRDGDQLQIRGEGLEGDVVVLGQQRLTDGALVTTVTTVTTVTPVTSTSTTSVRP